MFDTAQGTGTAALGHSLVGAACAKLGCSATSTKHRRGSAFLAHTHQRHGLWLLALWPAAVALAALCPWQRSDCALHPGM